MLGFGSGSCSLDLSSAFGDEIKGECQFELPDVDGCSLVLSSAFGDEIKGDCQYELPDVLSWDELPDVDNLQNHAKPQIMTDVSQETSHELHYLPSLDTHTVKCVIKQKRKERRKRATTSKPTYLRNNAFDDLQDIACMYGSDLIDVPQEWLDVDIARSMLVSLGILVWTVDETLKPLDCQAQIFLLEVFAGCWHLTRACIESGYRAGPSIDILPAFGGGHQFDLLTSASRRVVWAILVCLRPMWMHSGYPCTFWSSLAHCTRNRDETLNEKVRKRELVYIFSHGRLPIGRYDRAAM